MAVGNGDTFKTLSVHVVETDNTLIGHGLVSL